MIMVMMMMMMMMIIIMIPLLLLLLLLLVTMMMILIIAICNRLGVFRSSSCSVFILPIVPEILCLVPASIVTNSRTLIQSFQHIA